MKVFQIYLLMVITSYSTFLIIVFVFTLFLLNRGAPKCFHLWKRIPCYIFVYQVREPGVLIKFDSSSRHCESIFIWKEKLEVIELNRVCTILFEIGSRAVIPISSSISVVITLIFQVLSTYICFFLIISCKFILKFC